MLVSKSDFVVPLVSLFLDRLDSVNVITVKDCTAHLSLPTHAFQKKSCVTLRGSPRGIKIQLLLIDTVLKEMTSFHK